MSKITTILDDGIEVRFTTTVDVDDYGLNDSVLLDVMLTVRDTVAGLDVRLGVNPVEPSVRTLVLEMGHLAIDVTPSYALVQRDFMFTFIRDVLAALSPTEVKGYVEIAQRLAARHVGI